MSFDISAWGRRHGVTSLQSKPVSLELLEGLARCGRWFSAVNGVAIVVVCSLIISSYAAFESSPSSCVTQHAVADALAGGIAYGKIFLGAGLCSLLANALPGILRLRQLAFLSGEAATAVPPQLTWRPTKRLALVQSGLLVLGALGLLLGVYAATSNAQSFATHGMAQVEARFARGCPVAS